MHGARTAVEIAPSKSSTGDTSSADTSSDPDFLVAYLLSKSTPPTPSEQKRYVKFLAEKNSGKRVKDRQPFFLISQSWFRSWKSFVGYDQNDCTSASATAASPGNNVGVASEEVGLGLRKSNEAESATNIATPIEEASSIISGAGTLAFGPGSIDNIDLVSSINLTDRKDKISPTTQSEKVLNANTPSGKLIDLLRRSKESLGVSFVDILGACSCVSDIKSLARSVETSCVAGRRKGTSGEDADWRLLPPGQILEDVHYMLVPEHIWCVLHHWYGGGPEIRRNATVSRTNRRKYWVELYPKKIVVLFWNMTTSSRNTTTVREVHRGKIQEIMDILSLSEFSKVLTAKQVASTLFGVPYHKVTAFALEDREALLGDKRSNGALSIVSGSGRGIKSGHDQFRNVSFRLLDDSKTLGGEGIVGDYAVVVMKYTALSLDGAIYRNSRHLSRPAWIAPSRRTHLRTEDGIPGRVGLINIGNTCFMGALLQCLSKLGSVVAYFCADTGMKKLESVCGSQSLHFQLALLLRQMWCGRFSILAPYSLKSVLVGLFPQYAGYRQHDVEELFLKLLETLRKEGGNSRQASIGAASLPDNFAGTTVATTVCLGCGQTTRSSRNSIALID